METFYNSSFSSSLNQLINFRFMLLEHTCARVIDKRILFGTEKIIYLNVLVATSLFSE